MQLDFVSGVGMKMLIFLVLLDSSDRNRHAHTQQNQHLPIKQWPSRWFTCPPNCIGGPKNNSNTKKTSKKVHKTRATDKLKTLP
mmetsp:Transcript_21539/g.38198  ORF Transcript_21539/g.38198 Transcript_21539/m.38198 type:complete len:84 (+) Transcript_21539:821-1072(+)